MKAIPPYPTLGFSSCIMATSVRLGLASSRFTCQQEVKLINYRL